MDFPPRKTRRPILDHFVIISVAILTFAIFMHADDEINGKAHFFDAFGFTSIYLVAAYYIARLPLIWQMSKRTRFENLVMPFYFFIMLAFFYLSFVIYFVQPAATAMTVFAQLGVLIYFLCRS